MLSAALAACGDASSLSGGGGLEPGSSRLVVALQVDVPSGDRAWQSVDAINVEIERIRVKTEEGWSEGTVTSTLVNLLDLRNGGLHLGALDFPAGTLVKEIRLIMPSDGTSEVVTHDGVAIPLKVPSGTSSGIKLKGKFQLDSCHESLTTLVIDGARSIKYHQKGTGEYQLRPVIKNVTSLSIRDEVCGEGLQPTLPSTPPAPEVVTPVEPDPEFEPLPDEAMDEVLPPVPQPESTPIPVPPSSETPVNSSDGACTVNADCESFELCSMSGSCIPNL